MRGEHDAESVAAKVGQGSSPHARGARCSAPNGLLRIGLIPACAGSTLVVVQARMRLGAHPRMRGEHRAKIDFGRNPDGSSPHARGALVMRHPFGETVGLIPACAGSTRAVCTRSTHMTAHPRMRGEHTYSGSTR